MTTVRKYINFCIEKVPRHAIKTYGGVEVKLRGFLTSALDGQNGGYTW